MASTPYLPQDKREYIVHHGLEQMMSIAINELIRNSPNEPASYLAKHFSGLSDTSIRLDKMVAKQTYLDEKSPYLEITATVVFKGQSYTFKYTHQASQDYENPKDVLIEKHEPAPGQVVYDLSKAVAAINTTLAPFLKEKDLATLADFDDKFLTYCREHHLNYKNVTSAVSFAALNAVASLYNRQVLQQLTLQISGVEESERVYPMPNVQFRLISGGPFMAAKFRPTSVSLVLSEDSHLDWRAVLLLARRVYFETENVIVKGKGGKDLLKTALDGSYISPVDTLAEVLKIIEEALKAANAGDNFNFAINFSAHKYWNKEISKYEFENFKKGSDPEEVEEMLAKLLLEKKSIKYIQDPFLLEHRLSWHRLNLKLKEKGHSVHFTSRKYYNSVEEKRAFNADVTEGDFPPKTKNAADLVGKLNSAKVHISQREISFGDFFTCSDFLKKYSEYKKIHAQDHMQLIVADGSQVLQDDCFLDLCLAAGITNVSLGSPTQLFRYISYQKKPIGPREHKVPDPATEGAGAKKDDLAKSGSSTNLKDSDKKVAGKDSGATIKGAKK